MKKTLLKTVGTLVLVGLVGCSSGNPVNNSQNQQETPPSQNNSVENNDLIGTETNEVKIVYGKIVKLIGNEVEVNLAKNPFSDGEEDTETKFDEATMVRDTVTSVPSGDGESQIVIPTEELEKLELEYTGETESYTIPAGISVFNYLTGTEGSVNDLKEGSVVAMMLVGAKDAMKIQGIEIME